LAKQAQIEWYEGLWDFLIEKGFKVGEVKTTQLKGPCLVLVNE
jgi:hypothetical protein